MLADIAVKHIAATECKIKAQCDAKIKQAAELSQHQLQEAMKQVPVECSIENSIEYSIEPIIECSIICTVEYSIECSIECPIEIECSIGCSVECSIEYAIECSKRLLFQISRLLNSKTEIETERDRLLELNDVLQSELEEVKLPPPLFDAFNG